MSTAFINFNKNYFAGIYDMDVKNTRVKKLTAFVNENNGPAAIERKHPEISASYLSQLINLHRPFGEKSARKLENILGLKNGYFDNSDFSYQNTRIETLTKIMQELPDYAQDEVIRDALKTAELIAKVKSEKNGTEK